MGHRERQPQLLAGVGIVEQTMLAQASVEGGRRQLGAGEESFFEQPSIQHRVRQLALLVGGQRGQHLADGLGQLGHRDLAREAAIGPGGVVEGGQAVLFEAVEPGADGSPGEAVVDAALGIGEGAGGDLLDALADTPRRRVREKP
jgi:hypothetical protein